VKTVLAKIHLILTLDCEQSSRIISESLDRHLTFSERWAVRLHYLGCWSCRRFKRQIEFLREAVRRKDEADLSDAESSSESGLSVDAKHKIRDAMSRESTED
jgi:hypothetical protein